MYQASEGKVFNFENIVDDVSSYGQSGMPVNDSYTSDEQDYAQNLIKKLDRMGQMNQYKLSTIGEQEEPINRASVIRQSNTKEAPRPHQQELGRVFDY